MDCRKCQYFEAGEELGVGKVIVGFCKLRGKHISNLTITNEFCKDKASIDMPSKKLVPKPAATKFGI